VTGGVRPDDYVALLEAVKAEIGGLEFVLPGR